MNKRLKWQLPFLALLIVGSILIISQQREDPYQKYQGFVFGTVYNITYQSEDDYSSEIKAKLMEVDSALSTFNEASIISKVNRNEDVELNAMFIEVFDKAMEVSKATNGAFDITVAPLVNAWGFGFKSGEFPSNSQVNSLRRLVGYEKVRREGNRVMKSDPRVTIDCSAIAKGYGSDAVAKLLEDKGVDNYMIEIGGEIVVKGVNSKRMPWKIGVTKPTDDSLSTSTKIEAVMNITDKAIATSGNYRNFYYKDGKKYAHTIDPKTGRPVQHNILSATVIADDCTTADAYATAFMVMGLEKAKKVLDEHRELQAYFICSGDDGKSLVWYSHSLENKIEK